jgi:ribosomal-protein-serine acetyltransferase
MNAEVQIRPLKEKDAGVFFRLVEANREHLRQWLPWVDEHTTLGHSRSFLGASEMQLTLRNGGLWGIFLEKELQGTVSLHWIQWEHRSASLGYWLASGSQGKGYARQACGLLLRHAFLDLELHRVEASAAVENGRSLRLLRNLGFQEEGRRRDAEFLHGKYLDHLAFGILADDFPFMDT